ncbi:MAG: aldehyde reductase [Bacteroidota bacterium]|nr:aldehyde reductase [Bacteroidota bacterium]
MAKTIMVTGGTGYIGSWVTKYLLEKGYQVRLTVRNKSNQSKFEHLLKIAENSEGALDIREADLLKEGSYDEAARGCEAIMHIASPYTLRFKNPKKELIDPALEGTRNVLGAAIRSGTVKKVILTSSVAAVHGDAIDMQEQQLDEFTEDDWNHSSSVKHQPYSYSKVLAEREAWKMFKEQDQWKLVVINPSFVIGPSLTALSNSESLNILKDMTSGKYALGVPELWFGFVDVRDVAKAHLIALEKADADGRHILAEQTMKLLDLANLIRKNFDGKYKLPKSETPKFLLYLVGWMFGLSAKFIKRNVGYPVRLKTDKSKEKLGLKYTPVEQSAVDMIEQMHKQGLA